MATHIDDQLNFFENENEKKKNKRCTEKRPAGRQCLGAKHLFFLPGLCVANNSPHIGKMSAKKTGSGRKVIYVRNYQKEVKGGGGGGFGEVLSNGQLECHAHTHTPLCIFFPVHTTVRVSLLRFPFTSSVGRRVRMLSSSWHRTMRILCCYCLFGGGGSFYICCFAAGYLWLSSAGRSCRRCLH